MKNIVLVLSIVVMYMCSGFIANPTQSALNILPPTGLNNSEAGTTTLISSGTYVGVLPCADCSGIEMTLNLQDIKVGKRKAFVMEQTFKGKPSQKNKLKIDGIWIPVRGNFQNKNAIIIQLIPNGNYDPMYLLKIDNSAIRLLNRKQDKIASKHTYILKRM